MNNNNALIVKLDEHRLLVLEKRHVTFAPLVVNNRQKEQRLAWIVYQVDTKPTMNNNNVLIVKLDEHRLRLLEVLTVMPVPKADINQRTARQPV